MPGWLEAGSWGLLGGGALVIGALVAWFVDVPKRVVAGVMAFGAGVLISAVAFDLVDEAVKDGGAKVTAVAFFVGAVMFVGANTVLDRYGARHRKRSGKLHPGKAAFGGGAAIAVGALLDGVPESVVLGVSMLEGGEVSIAVLSAIFISNLPEGLSSAAGMKRAGRSAKYVFGVWGGIAIASGIAAFLGYTLLGGASALVIAGISALAAGAILAMVADTMIPEAFEDAHALTGLITAMGFLAALAIHLAA